MGNVPGATGTTVIGGISSRDLGRWRPCTDSAPCSFLLVEDDDLVADAFLVQTAREAGGQFVFDRARTLGEAVRRLRAERYDLVWLDVGLSDSGGLRTLDAVAEATNRTVPIIVLTGAVTESPIEYLERGAVDILLKAPGRPHSDLLAVMRLAIDRQRVRNRNKLVLDYLVKRVADLERLLESAHGAGGFETTLEGMERLIADMRAEMRSLSRE